MKGKDLFFVAFGIFWIIAGVVAIRSSTGVVATVSGGGFYGLGFGLMMIVMGVAALVMHFYDKRKESGLHPVTVQKQQSNHNISPSANSAWEDEIATFVNRVCPCRVVRNDRTIIPSRSGGSNLEIDIYIPDLRLGIECNGEHWHDHKQYRADTYQGTEISEEMYKEKYCKRKGITLIHVWDSQEMSDIQSQIKRAIFSQL